MLTLLDTLVWSTSYRHFLSTQYDASMRWHPVNVHLLPQSLIAALARCHGYFAAGNSICLASHPQRT